MTVGLVIVSHSSQLAQGVVALAQQMTKGATPIASGGGTDDGNGNEILGTSAERIAAAIQSVDSPDGVLVLLDLGSAILSTEVALEFLDDEQRSHVQLSFAPLVEGTITAAIEASMGSTIIDVKRAAEDLASVERLRNLKPFEQEERDTEQLEAQTTPLQLSQETGTAGALEASFVIVNAAGLHARPASLFVQTAKSFPATVKVHAGERSANADSIIDILSLGVRPGETIVLRVRGTDAQKSLDALRALIEDNFHEPLPTETSTSITTSSTPPARQVQETQSTYQTQRAEGASDTLRGIVTSPGVASGPALLYTSQALTLTTVERRSIETTQVANEQQRLRDALDTTAQELQTLARQLQERIGANEAAIFDAQALMLQDPTLYDTASHILTEQQLDAASALAEAGEQYAQRLATLPDSLLAGRAADVRDVTSKTIRHIREQRIDTPDLNALEQPVILLAYDLTPSDTAQFQPGTILGICTVQGGRNAHAAILARALGIPALAGLDEAMLHVLHNGDEISLDATQGEQGTLYFHPTPELRITLTQRMTRHQQERTVRQANARQEPLVLDGKHIALFANVGSVIEAEAARQWGAEGIGLLRTEFLFASAHTLPDENEQRASYVKVFHAFKGQQQVNAQTMRTSIIARTLDAGADKPMPALQAITGTQQEMNPALGVRGIRIHLAHPELLEQQLRALLLASIDELVELHIMVPMLTTVEELRTVRTVFEHIVTQLQQSGIQLPEHVPLGVMVEVPSAALMAEELAREADFFSIGANDLMQYTLATDRTNAALASLYNPMQPSVLRLIRSIAMAGNNAGKLVAVCGEIASDALLAPVLIGLGVDELSMNPTALPTARAALTGHTLQELRDLATRACEMSTVAEVEALCRAFAGM